MNHLRELFIGFSEMAKWGPSKQPYLLGRDGFARDRNKLSTDGRRVASDLRKVSSRHGKSLPSR